MALTYDQISSITEKNFVKKLVDNIFRSNVLLDRMLKKGSIKLSGGERIIQPVMYAQSSSDVWFANAETLNTTDVDQFTAFEFFWKQAQVPISITRIDELKNSGPEAKINFVKEKTMAAEVTLKQSLGDAVYNAGTDSKQLVGLQLAVDSTGTYGGVDRSSNSWAAAQEDSTSTTTSIAALQSLWGSCSISDDVPTIITTTQAIYNRYYGLLQPQQRFQDTESAKGGFTSLMFNGKPFVVDHKVPTNQLYMLNENYLYLAIHQDENFRFRKFMDESKQAVMTARIFFAGALVCSNPRMQGKFTGLSS